MGVPTAIPIPVDPIPCGAVQRGLLRAVALVVDRGAIRRPLGLPADGLHARLPKLGPRTLS